MGEGPKKFYWALAGKKTVITLVVAALYGVCLVVINVFSQCVPECASAADLAQLQGYLDQVPGVLALGVGLGIFDAAVRLEPPKKDDYVTPPRG